MKSAALPIGGNPSLGDALRSLAERYGPTFLESDPVQFPHRYRRSEDREVVAFVAAQLAFGNARSIRASVERVLEWMGPSPSSTVEALARGEGPLLRGPVHRWVRGPDLRRFLIALGRVRTDFGSLQDAFLRGDDGGTDLLAPLQRFVAELRARTPLPHTRGVRSLLVSPEGGSACKRWHMLLRWLVRPADGIDLGLWSGMSPARLTIPLDTHVARIGTYIGLTARRTADGKMAAQITAALRSIDPADPTRFDFALARLGILDHCPRTKSVDPCSPCPLYALCQL